MATESAFGSFGRYHEVALADMEPEMKDAYDFTLKLRGLVPGPHKIWLANPLLSKTIVPTGAYFQKHSTLSKAEIEIATNVINSRWRSAYANFEHEQIAEQQGHIDPRRVQDIISGIATSFEDERQQVVYTLAVTLAEQRPVPVGLYIRAKQLLRDEGIVDVTVLMGWFTMVCLTLNAFDVPADAKGLSQ